MFNNIGAKIKVVAKVLCWLGIINSVLLGLGIIVFSTQWTELTGYYRSYSSAYSDFSVGTITALGIVLGILVIVLGSLFAWIGSFKLYGYGQLVENSEKIKETSEKILMEEKF